MKRTCVYLTALAGLGGVATLVAVSNAQQPGGAPGAAPPAAGTPAGPRPTVAVFNMASVMRDYGKAKYQVFQLNEKRKGMSRDLVVLRDEYLKIQKAAQSVVDPKQKEAMQQQLLDLARRIEDQDRKINAALNDDASAIISSLYDDIKVVVDKTAEMNGYHLVFAYPDAVTDEEKKNPYLKELKLKPPAAQPFYVSRQVDLTGVIVQTLNSWYPPKDGQGNVVDVSKLVPTPEPGAPAGGQPPAGGLPTGGLPPGPGGVPMGVPPAPTRP